MFAAATAPPLALDVPTLSFVAVGLSGLLGLFLIFAWLQQRDARALAWWGAAYLIGASSMALWGAHSPWIRLPPELPEALTFVACGVIWNGVRVFHGREVLPIGGLLGAIAWLAVSPLPVLSEGSQARLAVARLRGGSLYLCHCLRALARAPQVAFLEDGRGHRARSCMPASS